MSKIRYNAVMKSKAGPTMAARFILSILADKAKDDGYCYPGPEWIAKRANCDITTVRRALKALNEEGSLLTQKSDSFPKYEHLVLVGLTAEEVEEALEKHFSPLASRMMAAMVEHQTLFFNGKESPKNAECPSKNAECTKKNAECTPKNAECTKKMQNAPISVIDPLFDPSVDPSERDLSLKNGKTDFTESTTNTFHLSAMITAVHQACTLPSNTSRRKAKQISRAADELATNGYTPADLTLFARWWNECGIGRTGTAPHPSQIQDYIGQALNWKSKKANGSGSEYARAGQQPTYSPEERAQIEAQLNQEEDDGF